MSVCVHMCVRETSKVMNRDEPDNKFAEVLFPLKTYIKHTIYPLSTYIYIYIYIPFHGKMSEYRSNYSVEDDPMKCNHVFLLLQRLILFFLLLLLLRSCLLTVIRPHIYIIYILYIYGPTKMLTLSNYL